MTHIKIKSDCEEYKVAVNGVLKVDCVHCEDTGVITIGYDDDLNDIVCPFCKSKDEYDDQLK